MLLSRGNVAGHANHAITPSVAGNCRLDRERTAALWEIAADPENCRMQAVKALFFNKGTPEQHRPKCRSCFTIHNMIVKIVGDGTELDMDGTHHPAPTQLKVSEFYSKFALPAA